MSEYDAVFDEVLDLLHKRGLDLNDFVRVGMAIAGGAVGEISEDRAALEENLKGYFEVFKKAATDAFEAPDPENN